MKESLPCLLFSPSPPQGVVLNTPHLEAASKPRFIQMKILQGLSFLFLKMQGGFFAPSLFSKLHLTIQFRDSVLNEISILTPKHIILKLCHLLGCGEKTS